jgi:ElaB/YqjD/DUF883 family membrane-anchored ribosome-binding protein
MNYTKNYHLPQWDENDRVMRADFNQMCADMENGLLKTARDAAEDTAQASANADKAQATANKAVADAAAAQATANAAYCPSNKPYVIGTYTGTDAEQTVTVGFQPSFLMVVSPRSRDVHMYTMASGKGINSERLQFTAAGFKVFKDGVDGGTSIVYPPLINSKGIQYVYIAFR